MKRTQNKIQHRIKNNELRMMCKHYVVSLLVLMGLVLSVLIVLQVLYCTTGVKWRLPVLDVNCYDINVN